MSGERGEKTGSTMAMGDAGMDECLSRTGWIRIKRRRTGRWIPTISITIGCP